MGGPPPYTRMDSGPVGAPPHFIRNDSMSLQPQVYHSGPIYGGNPGDFLVFVTQIIVPEEDLIGPNLDFQFVSYLRWDQYQPMKSLSWNQYVFH